MARFRVRFSQVDTVAEACNLDGPEDTWRIKLRIHNSSQPFPSGKYWLKMSQLDERTQDLVRAKQLPCPEPRVPRD